MLKSGLLRCCLLIALGTIEIWAKEETGKDGELILHNVARVPRDEYSFLWERVNHAVAEEEDVVKRFIVERIPDSTRRRPKEQAAPALTTPQPTPPPQKRQDDGQIQALSQQLRSLSESATQAISSVSSSASSAMSLVSQSAQSVRQSADQAVQSANQNADNANRQLSQTQSSASSAVSAASARASDDISRSLSSMSSRISSNLASVQSSASSAISAAMVEARSSAANAVNIAASQIQEARADASGVRGDANSIVSQVQSNSVSATNVAIVVTASVVGTAILTTIASCFIVRYRRNKKRGREGLATAINSNNEIQYENPIAVRGTPGSPRFTPFGGGTGYPMDKFKLPDLTLSPFLKKRIGQETPSEIGFARSTYSNDDGTASVNNDVYGVSPSSFRLQKDNSIKSAKSVRLIRVGSNSNKGQEKEKEEDQKAPLSPILSPALPLPVETPKVLAAPVAASTQLQPQLFSPASPTMLASPTAPQIAEPPRATTRSVRNSEAAEEPVINPVQNTSTMTSQNRLRFRDSSDVESAEPSPANWTLSTARTVTAVNPMRNTNTASLRMTIMNTNGSDNGQSPPRRPKNAGASFATFPRVRNGLPNGSAAEAIMNKNRTGLNGVAARLREEAERRKRESAGVGGASDAVRSSRGPNWPFGGN
ncbi:hypothetical protein F4813DRAFT_138543 [Daldinia decipiens]|uniref:uncharacterized protein n=1 Tax=Daldinia decipiens TaxID=326647 RepID=UPI0020C2C779|nr:uncharacterized protein F4813DRAFT_138543 [Daldinia decipiens]KAI1656218.1 hypothetical protein F4813DRAFT_138543 [Daldinia decipiens]